MEQLVTGGWTQEQSDALEAHVRTGGKTYAEAVIAINETFGTTFTRNSAIGRANRIGLQSPKKERKPKLPRINKARKTQVRIVAANGNSNAMRVIETVVTDYKLRCVEIIPRGLTLLELEKNECRYPSDDAPFTFCGHPVKDGSSYCTPHHFLCWVPARDRTDKYWSDNWTSNGKAMGAHKVGSAA
jgi:GcrA cell cycle regulator